MDIRERRDSQLLRISRGANELTNMIDSWSKTSTLGFESIQMANELLRGSLELQESLQMLSRLQEASKKMSKERIRQRGREKDQEENFLKAMNSKNNESSCYMLQEPRLSVDCSTNSVEDLKQVIRDRLCKNNVMSLKSSNEKAFSSTNFSSHTRKLKAPSLIARLMGLEQFPSGSKDHKKIKVEEIIETMRLKGILKNDHSEKHKVLPDLLGTRFDQDRDEINLASEKISVREKTTLAELLWEEKTFDHCYVPMNSEPIQSLSMETKRNVDRKISIIEGKRFVELKQVQEIGESIKSEKGDKKSREKPVSKFITQTKTDDLRFEDGKLTSFGIETCAISERNSMIITDGLLTQEKKETIIFVDKDEIKKDHKIVCEVMPKTYQARRNVIEQSIKVSNNDYTPNPAPKSQHLFKHQLLNNKSFHDFVHSLFEIDAIKPMHSQAKISENEEIGVDKLLLDCAKELMALKIHEEKISITQMLQTYQRKSSSFLSFNHLMEEISKRIKELAPCSENGKGDITENSLNIMLEKDVERNNWVCLEEADEVAIEVEKQIFSKLVMEVAMDLVGV